MTDTSMTDWIDVTRNAVVARSKSGAVNGARTIALETVTDLSSAAAVPAHPTSSSADVIVRAQKAIAEYVQLIEVAYDKAAPALYVALAATYAVACDLKRHPERLACFLEERRPGPVSANPMMPVVRKLWRGVPTRDTIYRYAACIALAQREMVDPANFAEWLRTVRIKAAAAKWSRLQTLPNDKHHAAVTQMAKRDALLSKFSPVPLPEKVGAGCQPGLHMAAIRVLPGEGVELVAVFDNLSPEKVDAFIIRASR